MIMDTSSVSDRESLLAFMKAGADDARCMQRIALTEPCAQPCQPNVTRSRRCRKRPDPPASLFSRVPPSESQTSAGAPFCTHPQGHMNKRIDRTRPVGRSRASRQRRKMG